MGFYGVLEGFFVEFCGVFDGGQRALLLWGCCKRGVLGVVFGVPAVPCAVLCGILELRIEGTLKDHEENPRPCSDTPKSHPVSKGVVQMFLELWDPRDHRVQPLALLRHPEVPPCP